MKQQAIANEPKAANEKEPHVTINRVEKKDRKEENADQ